jgi:orotidine-5'-phosphate decarboxylase
MRYSEKLARRIEVVGAELCVGLDPRFDLITEDPLEFFRAVVGETAPFAAAFKPNIAYFEQLGSQGIHLLESVFDLIPKEIPIILDAKRSDIGETQTAYAAAYFKHWEIDAVTLNPFLGFDTIEPFLDFDGKGIYLLAVTSNPGAAEFQMQRVANDGRYVFEHVCDMTARTAGRATDVGLVVGLTNATADVLSKIPDVPLLVPGLGAQGGEISRLQTGSRKAPILVNVSRGILYAEPAVSFGEKARRWVDLLRSTAKQ